MDVTLSDLLCEVSHDAAPRRRLFPEFLINESLLSFFRLPTEYSMTFIGYPKFDGGGVLRTFTVYIL
jgi:hypothetical protein